MPITLSDCIYRVRSRINEPAYPTFPDSTPGNPPARFYTDTELTAWINDGLRDISRRAEDLHTYDTTIHIPAYGENPHAPPPAYRLPEDIIRINRVEFEVFGDSSQRYPLEASSQTYMDNIWNIDQLSTMTYPSYWVTRGYPGGTGRNEFVIQMFPNPAQPGHLNLFYYRLPTRVHDPVADPSMYEAPLDLIEGWDDLIVDYCQMQAFIKQQNPLWQQIQSLYEQKMVNIVDQTRRFNDQPQYFNYDGMLMPWATDTWGGW